MGRQNAALHLELETDDFQASVKTIERVEQYDAHEDVLDDAKDEKAAQEPVEDPRAFALRQ